MTAEPELLVERLLGRCSFPGSDQSIDLAVSGGADSSALLVLATRAGCLVTVHHVDHGLRRGSSEEAAAVSALASRFGAGFVAHRVQVEPGPNLEARARAARFAVLPTGVVTGHTLDDRAETVLLNLMRGAGRRGQSPLRDPARQPIRDLRRAETEEVCRAFAITPIDDAMNRDPAFTRTRVRHELLPLLDDIAQRDVAPLLARHADLTGAEDDLLDELASVIDATDAKALAAAPVALARRAVRRFVMQGWSLDHPPSSASIERILRVARGHAASVEIEGGNSVHRTAQRLRLEPPSLL